MRQPSLESFNYFYIIYKACTRMYGCVCVCAAAATKPKQQTNMKKLGRKSADIVWLAIAAHQTAIQSAM